ncbi:MAG: ribonuclease HI [Lachnospiraceae bacterium]|nr:ribonuclease HI [Lachnospiraceae bacterium]
MTKVVVFSDGAARGNPNGPGGYGALVRFTDASGRVFEREYSQGFAVTTNNRMELLAAIVALENLRQPCEVDLYSDSKYLVDAFNEDWMSYWRTHEFHNKKGDLIKNDLLWRRLAALTERHSVTFHWVKGHSGHPENERCDHLATSAADGDELYLDDGGDLLDPKPAPERGEAGAVDWRTADPYEMIARLHSGAVSDERFEDWIMSHKAYAEDVAKAQKAMEEAFREWLENYDSGDEG